MPYTKKHKIWRPTNKDESDFMKKAKENHIEKWMIKSEVRMREEYLKPLKQKWYVFKSQRCRWWRIYDFWCAKYWIAVEVDWWYHNAPKQKVKDQLRDKHNNTVSAIEVIRVNNYDEQWASNAIKKILWLEIRALRRYKKWLKLNNKRKKELSDLWYTLV